MTCKETLYKYCQTQVTEQLTILENTLASHQKALLSETKSSAGDKHETGRAMVQLEMEKTGKQLQESAKLQAVLAQVNYVKTSEHVCLGSLVYTSKGTYFISISLGKIALKNTEYYAVSPQAPIGRILLGKQAGDTVVWNEQPLKILKIE